MRIKTKDIKKIITTIKVIGRDDHNGITPSPVKATMEVEFSEELIPSKTVIEAVVKTMADAFEELFKKEEE